MNLHRIYIALLCIVISGCGASSTNDTPRETTLREEGRDSLFQQLMVLTGNNISVEYRMDSLAFLILPLDNSCPACRDKTMDSIAKHLHDLRPGHYIVLSANSGIKNMRSTFQENGRDMPVLDGKVFIDSANLAYNYDLYASNPSMFYAADGQVFKSVFSLPASIKEDLMYFFSGISEQ